MQAERRKKRSCNVHQALELQLGAVAQRAGASSLILTEHQGIPVAGAGNVAQDEDVVALAPSLVSGTKLWRGQIAIDNGPEKQVTIAPFNCDVGKLFLCAVGGDASRIVGELLIGCKGVNRILA